MTELLFDFEEMIAEVSSFTQLAAPFLAEDARHVLPRLEKSLITYRDAASTTDFSWEIPKDSPLRTKLSHGQYEAKNRGGPAIRGEVTAKWQIRRVPGKKRSDRSRHFKLVGLASTCARLFSAQDVQGATRELAMWRMEVGDKASPGCHFHTQILGVEPDTPFPSSLPVPRFPGLMLTPMAVVEFLLAEMFQDDWARHVGRDSAHLKRWAPIQRARFVRLLKWKLDKIGSGSPWTTLKWQKPKADLFV